MGARPLAGRSSIGYRSVVFVPSDGVEQAIRFVNREARLGDRVACYFAEAAIGRSFAAPGLRLEWFPPVDELAAYDYVVNHLNREIVHGWGAGSPSGDVFRPIVDRARISAGFEKVLSIRRAFDLEVCSVWARRKHAS